MKLALLLLAGLLSGAIFGQAQPFAVEWKTTRPPEMDELRYLEVKFAGNKFTLVPPVGCLLQTDLPSSTVQLSASTGSVSMTIQFSTNSSRSILASRETLQEFASPIGTQTEVREEFPAYSGATPGKGIELRFNLHGQPMWRRAAIVPFSGGYASFIATSKMNESKAAQNLFGGIVNSFQQATSSP